ncbi:DsrE/DsrF/DrsH-like family protein [Fervidicoccus fontis]|uniref:DsrE/DsrF/DrsH-like family protein n=1 Tax=Fervidicoccus fontis TaxID=683846 RepID=A0A843AJF9_9CREN|nr:DsrE/DsrF/DrsH-like family protein [Fervidicoccus fontis]MBE9391580.1 DsrE/DsrF/DrsH-like family protein [Fervidicoccus fontis]
MAVAVFSGSIDRLTGLAMLVSGAVAMGYEVELFLQLWGVYAFKKDIVKKNMNFSEFQDKAPEVAKRLQELNVPSWFDIIKEAKENGSVKIYACSAAASIWNVKKEDLELVDDIIGAATWIEKMSKADITLFI